MTVIRYALLAALAALPGPARAAFVVTPSIGPGGATTSTPAGGGNALTFTLAAAGQTSGDTPGTTSNVPVGIFVATQAPPGTGQSFAQLSPVRVQVRITDQAAGDLGTILVGGTGNGTFDDGAGSGFPFISLTNVVGPTDVTAAGGLALDAAASDPSNGLFVFRGTAGPRAYTVTYDVRYNDAQGFVPGGGQGATVPLALQIQFTGPAATVPEPASLALAGVGGLAAVAARARRRAGVRT